ncbi:MAG: T9SS type A sorting domain-containing protein [Flavobacteriales bacterium]
MKTKFTLICIFFFSVFTLQSQEYVEMIHSGEFTVSQIIESAEAYFADKDKGRGSGYIPFKRWEYNAKRLMNTDGYLPNFEERLLELEQFNAYLNETSNTRQVLNDNWEELGPFSWNQTSAWSPGVGRITGISIDQTNHNHIIVGANTGGVWKTTNGGEDWEPLGDYFSNLQVYSVAIDPQNPDIYYFGSISGLLYKSIDAGATWNLLGNLGGTEVNRILIHPTDSNIMFGTVSNGGIKKSIDGGITWESAVTDYKGYDIEFKPGDPSVVYASGSGFHKSIDGGNTFNTIEGFSSGAKMIGVSPDDNEIVYVLEEYNGSFGGFYYSNDSGDSFIERDHTGRNYFGYDTNGYQSGGQAPRDMDIAVNPNNVNEVHIAGVLTWRSLDGGIAFENTSDWIPYLAEISNKGYCHADVDILVFNGTTLFVGTDGGIYKADDTTNLNANYYEDITEGLGIRQFYKIGVSQSETLVVTGGSQDNGTGAYNETDGWRDWLGADGMETFVDKYLVTTLYGTSQYGQMYRSSNGGLTYADLPEPGVGSGAWVTPFEQDPVDVNTIYVGYRRFYKSTNRGNTWTSISQDFGSDLHHLKIAPSNNQIMYAARGGFLYKTEDGGTTNWQQITNPGGVVNSIAIHPTNPELIAVATTNSTKPVQVSSDGGITWQNYKLNLPAFSALALIWDDNGKEGLYLGMDYGIYYIDNTFSEWQPYHNLLPNVIVSELEINNETNMLYAGTYGRGLWASPLVEDLLNNQDFLSQEDLSIYPNPANNQISIISKQTVTATIKVFNVVGKLIQYHKNCNLGNHSFSINIASLEEGVYFLRINSSSGTLTKKFIKN